MFSALAVAANQTSPEATEVLGGLGNVAIDYTWLILLIAILAVAARKSHW